VAVAGSGVGGFQGIGGPAAEAELSTPIDLAFDRDGNLYVAERYGDRVVVVRDSGLVEHVAGELDAAGVPIPGFAGDGGPATSARLDGVNAIAVDADGNVYLADTMNNRVRRIDRSGAIGTVVGTGEQGSGGDGGPAIEAQLHWPTGLVIDDLGNLFINDSGSRRIRRVNTEGIIATVAGTGQTGTGPDGALATEASLGYVDDHAPNGLAFDRQGRLHISDYGNFRVWRIDEDTRMRTVAGIGTFSSSGDGGPAIEAGISGPLDVCFGPDGSLYIATHSHGSFGNEVRRVDPTGRISTVAGAGPLAYSGDGGPAIDAAMAIPSGIAIGPDGNLYIADAGNNRIRMVALIDS
jgi:sugar lactone lactonase YvrE